MIEYVLRQLLVRPGRTLLVVASIVIGVAAIVAVTAATSATQCAYDDLFTSLSGRADLEVVAVGGGPFDGRSTGMLEEIPGIEAAVAVLQRPTVLYHGPQRIRLVAVGIHADGLSTLQNHKLAAGRFPTGDAEVALEQQFARSLHLTPGDQIKLLTRKGVKRLTVSGLTAPKTASAANPSSALFLELSAAQSLLARRNEVDLVQLALCPDADSAKVVEAISAKLPATLRVRRPVGQGELSHETKRGTDLGLWFATALTLEVAVVVILHTFFMNVGQRRRQLAILRTIGATPHQIRLLLLGEVLTLGIVASAVGLPIGLAAANLLSMAMESLLQMPLPAIELSWAAVVAAAITGPALAVIGTLLPARVASRVSPLEGMRAVSLADPERAARHSTGAGLALAAVCVAMFTSYAAGVAPPWMLIAGGALALLASCLLLPAVLRPFTRAISKIIAGLWGAEGELACEQLLRRPARTALTVGVLFIAASAAIGIANALLNDLDDAHRWFRRTLVADYFVRAIPDPATGLAIPMSEELGAELSALDGVARVGTIRFVSARAEDQAIVLVIRDYVRSNDMQMDLQESVDGNLRTRLADGEVLIGTALAERFKRRPGDDVMLETKQGPRPMRIAAVVNEYAVGGLVVCLDREVAEQWFDFDGVDVFLVHASQPAANVKPALETLCQKHGLLLHSFDEFHTLFDGMINGVIGSLWIMLIVAVAVAAFGMTSTLAMNVLEQTREIGLLRIVGMIPSQVRRLVVCQAVAMAAIALLPAAIAGVAVAWLMNLCTPSMLGHRVAFAVDPLLVGVALLISFAMIVVAALVPARRAVRIDLVESLHHE